MKATCPTCGSEVSARTLPELKKALRKCPCSSSTKARSEYTPASKLTAGARFVFERDVLSQNKTTYSHWTAHHRDKKRWAEYVKHLMWPYFGSMLPYSVWSITRVYSSRKREMDMANIVGGFKPLVDLLSEFGIIVDDSPRYFECSYNQEKGGQTHVALILKEIRDAREAKKT